MRKIILILINLIFMALLYDITTQKSVAFIMYGLSRVPILIYDVTLLLYITEKHCTKNVIQYAIRPLKRLVFYYEVLYVINTFRSISSQGEYEVVDYSATDSKFNKSITRLIEGTDLFNYIKLNIDERRNKRSRDFYNRKNGRRRNPRADFRAGSIHSGPPPKTDK